jgi:hypothetical protein
MKTQTQITQITFNINNLSWKMYFHIRGCSVGVDITAKEAECLLDAIRQDETDRVTVETSPTSDLIFYIIN